MAAGKTRLAAATPSAPRLLDTPPSPMVATLSVPPRWLRVMTPAKLLVPDTNMVFVLFWVTLVTAAPMLALMVVTAVLVLVTVPVLFRSLPEMVRGLLPCNESRGASDPT